MVHLVLAQHLLEGPKDTHAYMLILTHDGTRPCSSTMLLQTSKRWNLTIEQQYWCVLSERAQGCLYGGLDNGVHECTPIPHLPCFPADMCTYNGMLDSNLRQREWCIWETILMWCLQWTLQGNKVCPVLCPNCLFDSHRSSLIPRHAHHQLMGSLAQILGSPHCCWYFKCQCRHHHINTCPSGVCLPPQPHQQQTCHRHGKSLIIYIWY